MTRAFSVLFYLSIVYFVAVTQLAYCVARSYSSFRVSTSTHTIGRRLQGGPKN